MNMNSTVALIAAGFLGGGLNALAGGGTFFTLPALVGAGLTPLVANSTGAFALLPGYAAAAFSSGKALGPIAGLSRRDFSLIAFAGGAAGALLLVTTPDAVFRFVVPWLILLATAAFAAGPAVAARLAGEGRGRPRLAAATLFAIATYGGYFNGGMGILLLAHARCFGEADIVRAQAMKNAASALLTAVAVVIYCSVGRVAWPEAVALTAGAIAGGYLGGLTSTKVHERHLRVFIIIVGVCLAAAFFVLSTREVD